MSKWTHNICWSCWKDQKGQEIPNKGFFVPNPTRILAGGIAELQAICCFCGHDNIEGIYTRKDPSETPCEGNHLERWLVVTPYEIENEN